MTNRRKLLASLPALALASRPAPAAEWTDPFARSWRDSFLKHWQVTKDYTIAFADALPAEDYGYKPVEVQRSYAEQLLHLGSANAAYMSAFNIKQQPARVTATDKAAVRAYLVATFDYVSAVLGAMQEKDLIRRDLQFALARDHYPVRVYIPYGTEWYPYLTRRIAERPANVRFFLESLARG